VRIASKPGQGTTVELWLPQAPESSPGGAPDRSDSTAPPGMATVLLCDDDRDVRRFLGELLRSDGYTVLEASCPEAALRLLEDGAAVDLLIVDYALPGLNGLEIIRQAQHRRPSLRALLITGDAGALSDREASAPVLRKPFRPAEFSRSVAAILAA